MKCFALNYVAISSITVFAAICVHWRHTCTMCIRYGNTGWEEGIGMDLFLGQSLKRYWKPVLNYQNRGLSIIFSQPGGQQSLKSGRRNYLLTEEPYAGNPHVRICGGPGWVTAGPTRKWKLGTGLPSFSPAGEFRNLARLFVFAPLNISVGHLEK